MLWYKSWLETRSRFLIGLALLICSAAAAVFTYPRVVQLLTVVPTMDLSGALGRRIAEAAALAHTYRGYVWAQWFRQNLIQMWTIFAVLLGTGGVLSQGSGGGALFTLSLPASRSRLIAVRAATGLGELAVLALVPSLMIPLLSPGIGETYPLGDALVHGFCVFAAGTVFFSLASLLSTMFPDVWRPLLIALCAAILLSLTERVFLGPSSFGLFGVMSGERYFRGGGVPWPGLVLSGLLSAAMLYGAARNLARRDF
jgi:ABC-2 type transport system permease protein